MALHRHYPHAPIKEALIDLAVTHRDGVSLQDLKQFGSKIKGQYPFESSRDVVQAEFQIGPASQGSSTRSTIGFLYHSSDRRQAVQARLNGFTFSRFEPYLDWHALRDEAKRLWEVFVDCLNPTEIRRVAVRYVNQLNLPLQNGTVNFDTYLSTFLKIGEDAGKDQLIEEFLIRLVLPQPDIDAKLVLTEALLPPTTPQSVGVILDIDLFRENTTIPPRSEDLWHLLDTFRHRKNDYFEASVTDAARELFR